MIDEQALFEAGNLFKYEPVAQTKAQARRNLQKALSAQELLAPYQHDVEEPNTSFLAAQKVKGKVGTELIAAYEALQEHPQGLTDFQLAEALELKLGRPIRPTSAGARRVALRDQYRVVKYAGFTRKTDSGSSAKVWKIKEEGL